MEGINLAFIAKRRVECGWTQQNMAEFLGFKNASTYQKYEKGEYDFKAIHLPILTRKLGCSLQDLFYNHIC
jgi:DNA-binding XRE family transcriptional regulator